MANKELFKQPLKGKLNDDDRFAVGIPGLSGAYNITFDAFRKRYMLPEYAKWTQIEESAWVISAGSKIISIDFKNLHYDTIQLTLSSTDDAFNLGTFELVHGQVLELVFNKIVSAQTTVNFSSNTGLFNAVAAYIKNYI